MEARTATALAAGSAALALSACAQNQRQDTNEPKGRFSAEVVNASFPKRQALAKRSRVIITVRNTGQKTIPDLAVTLHGFDYRTTQPNVADPRRPRFVINGVPKRIGGFAESQDASPGGGQTAYVDTWALGPLRPGRQKTFRWGVTAVKSGPYKLSYIVAAGLTGKARAIDVNTNRAPRGQFVGTVAQKPPQTRIDDDGHTIIQGTR